MQNDNRFDLSANNNKSIINAIVGGHLNIVEMLLKDKRVDPSAKHYFPFNLACTKGKHLILKVLLKDKRINSIEKINYGLLLATYYIQVNCVKILLKDERVDPKSFYCNAYFIACTRKSFELTKIIEEEIAFRYKNSPKKNQNYFAELIYTGDIHTIC